MKFILSIIIILISLIISGVITLCGVITLTRIGFLWWFLGSIIFTMTFFKWKFKSFKRFKISFQRLYLKSNYFFSKIDIKLSYSDDDKNISELQDKGIRLWKLCLRDKKTSISCSISNRIRQIEKDNMVIVLSPINSIDYLMTIIDTDQNKSCLYEIKIGQKLAEGVISSFDNENEKRMRQGEDKRRNLIIKDLDKLLQLEEMSIKPQK